MAVSSWKVGVTEVDIMCSLGEKVCLEDNNVVASTVREGLFNLKTSKGGLTCGLACGGVLRRSSSAKERRFQLAYEVSR